MREPGKSRTTCATASTPYTAPDKTFPKRASQDNAQVKALYDSWLGKPLGHKSEELLHTKWFDKSEGLKKLTASGAYPNPRHKDFAGNAYPYE